MVPLEYTDVTDAAVKGPGWSVRLAVVTIKPIYNKLNRIGCKLFILILYINQITVAMHLVTNFPRIL